MEKTVHVNSKNKNALISTIKYGRIRRRSFCREMLSKPQKIINFLGKF